MGQKDKLRLGVFLAQGSLNDWNWVVSLAQCPLKAQQVQEILQT